MQSRRWPQLKPMRPKRRPKLSIDGKYSIPFTTAVMMVKGNVTLHDYTDRDGNFGFQMAEYEGIAHLPILPQRNFHSLYGTPLLMTELDSIAPVMSANLGK